MDAARGDGLSMPSSTVVPPNDLRDSVTETAEPVNLYGAPLRGYY
jgi:hypothetical protein